MVISIELFDTAFLFNLPQLPSQGTSQLGASEDELVVAPDRSVSTFHAHTVQELAAIGRAEEGVWPGGAEHFVSTTKEDVHHGRAPV
jgi:hypothetical protein